MIAPFEETGWQFAELRKIMCERQGNVSADRKPVFLMNPEDRERLDDLIMTHFWPRVPAAIKGADLAVMPQRNGERRGDIYDKHREYAARELMFCLEDPKRRVTAPNHAPWFLRGCIECSATGYMASFDFYLYLPITFSLRRILTLLKNPGFSGLPPNMSYGHCSRGPDSLTIGFQHGSGAGWGIESPQVAGNHFDETLRNNLRIIEAVYALEKDFRSVKAFNELTRRLLTVYRAE